MTKNKTKNKTNQKNRAIPASISPPQLDPSGHPLVPIIQGGEPQPNQTSTTPSPPLQQNQTWPLDRFIFYARNPRKNDAAVDRMCSSIREL